MTEKDLQKLASSYQRSQDLIDESEKVRGSFLKKYPVGSWKTMPLDEFVIGSGKQTLCWWLEYNSRVLGSIKGGNSTKFQIYLSKKGEYVYDRNSFSSPAEAWEVMRGEIVEMLRLASDGRFEELDRKNQILYKANTFRGKLLYIYFPDQFLPIYALDHLYSYLMQLGIPKVKWENKSAATSNRVLWTYKNSSPLFKDWNPLHFMRMLYEQFPPTRNYWKVAPGPNAKIWEECLENGYIVAGWEGIEDVGEYTGLEELKKAFQTRTFPNSPSTGTKKARELWSFSNLQPGDQVLANDGQTRIVGVGTVTDEGYQYRPELPHIYRHTVAVNWDRKFKPRDIPPQKDWFAYTIKSIPYDLFQELTADKTTGSEFTPNEQMFFNRLEQLLDQKGQLILYGPPGTGKTYLARRYVDWVQSKQVFEGKSSVHFWFVVANAIRWKWERLWNEGEVEFDYANIKKNFETAAPGDLIFCYQTEGSKRQVVGLAKVTQGLHDGSWGPCITVEGFRKFRMALNFDDFKNEPEYMESQPGRMGNRGTLFEADPALVSLFTQMLEETDKDVVKEIRRFGVKQDNVELVTFHPSFNYEDFMEGFKPCESENGQITFNSEPGVFQEICRRAEADSNQPYFLLIDEINRGNVAKIFGELLTVLEKDKRGVQVRLPQSKSWFAVPANIYLIATMNTADRSIKLLDAALKRRFAFVEVLPDPSLLDTPIENTNITLADLMNGLNQKLREILGRDKQIGHAYFMRNGVPVNTLGILKQIYRYEIIPLIQEYCYDRYPELAEIVGPEFIDVENETVVEEFFDGNEDAFSTALSNRFATLG